MKFLVLSVIACLAVSSQGQDAPQVQTAAGLAKGFQKTSEETGKPYNVYYGIPFAEPPVGDLRFKAPVEFQGPGDSVITSDDFRPRCFNVPGDPRIPMSEDCLHLNIFTPPDASPDNLKKVIVYVHGGAFIGGAASIYRPTSMVTDFDIIEVTIQYRLAGFGFLSADDEALPGNNGLRDQLMAIQWVNANIQLFGGDPNDITLNGESAGSMSCSALSITPQANGLFSKVILQSGTVLSHLAIKMENKPVFDAFATQAGCAPVGDGPDATEAAVECMQGKSSEEIIAAHPMLIPSYDSTFADWFPMTIAGTDTELFPEPPVDLLQDADYLRDNGVLDRKYLAGIVDNEGLLVPLFLAATGTDPTQLMVESKTLKNSIKAVMANYLGTNNVPPDAVAVAKFVYTHPKNEDGSISFEKALQVQDDDLFTIPLHIVANALLKANPDIDFYMYLFDTEPALLDPNGAYTGTCHTMDLLHEFDNHPELAGVYFYAKMDEEKFPVIKQIFRTYITDFAKTGAPAGEEWPRFELDSQEYMYICSEPEVRDHMRSRRVDLWLSYFEEVGNKIQRKQKKNKKAKKAADSAE